MLGDSHQIVVNVLICQLTQENKDKIPWKTAKHLVSVSLSGQNGRYRMNKSEMNWIIGYMNDMEDI